MENRTSLTYALVSFLGPDDDEAEEEAGATWPSSPPLSIFKEAVDGGATTGASPLR